MGPRQQNTLCSNFCHAQRLNVEDGGEQRARPLPEESIGKLNLNLAMHRLFTFPLDFHLKYSFDLLHTIAELGLYYENNVIRCKFCSLNLRLGEIRIKFEQSHTNSEKLNCKISAVDSKNMPMENVTSVRNYKSEANRLFSLLKKPDWQHVTPFDLAKSGIYYSGICDKVICSYCNLGVSDWEAGDTPDKEHRGGNPNCPFLSDKQSVTNIEIGSELESEGDHDAQGTPKSGTTTFDPNNPTPPEKPKDRGPR